MRISKEGYRVIGITGAICFALWLWFYNMLRSDEFSFLIWFGTFFFLLLWFFVMAFFREPRRVKIHDPHLIFSPCDGRVVVTEAVFEDEYMKETMLQISVFMSLTNVHVNWVPVAGVVEYFKHHHGRFLVAWHPKSSTENERTTTVIRMSDGGRVMFRQVAGFIARRIVSYMRVGHSVDQNGFAGFIKFGSRVDILIPIDSEILVEIGDGVVGSQTPIARLKRK
ncbi:MAG: phosphatidylserine decarboxylase family protein [Rikenellaceae bacterium]